MDTINDQENIKRIQQVDSRTRMILKTGPDARAEEWEQIHKEMEAGSGATKVNVSTVFSGDKSSMASILQELEEELQVQGDAVAEFEKQDWDDPTLQISQGWVEGLEFAIKLIKRHNGSPIQSETNQ